MDISIIICTYNRQRLLQRCLQSIAALETIGLEYEVLVVDNASTDDTKQVVEQASGINDLKYLYQAAQGKSYALNLALKAFNGKLLVFVDDDVQLNSQALIEFHSCYQAHGDQYDWFGGRVALDWRSAEIPTWFSDDIQTVLDGVLGIHDLGEKNRPYTNEDKYPIGASLSVTRELINKVGDFRTDLGPSGGARGASDDTDYLMRAQANGMRGYYVATAKALHYVDPNRLTLRGFYSYGYVKGVNATRADLKNRSAFSLNRVLSQFVRCCWQLAKGRQDNARVCLLNIGFEFGRLSANADLRQQ